ncbi:hypothetical protein [Streptomyces sp. NPDC127038]|uniref:hypothetical protein n=1 Tax=Streptomyces sp. NPDC127038 TaxID=3347114 RepID=UPI0036493D32
MTEPIRHTADTINDDDLDQLYDQLARVRDAVILHRQGLLTTAELYATVEANQPASTAPLAAGLPQVQGHCPACGRASLFLGFGGHVTCATSDCRNPASADEVLRHAHVTECEHASGQRQAESALARVRELRADLREITGARYIADALDTILAEEHSEQPMTTTDKPLCTATIDGPHVLGGGPVQCTREAGHPENHVGPKRGTAGRTLWTDHSAGATRHDAAAKEQH